MLKIEQEEFNPSVLTHNILEKYKQAAGDKGLTLKSKLGPKDLCTVPDARWFAHLINEIIATAIGYTDSGSVSVGLVMHISEPPKLVLHVHDSSSGIDPDLLAHLGEPFSRIDKSRAWRSEGIGKQLWIIQKLVEILDGDITVDSIIGRGTRYDVVVPIKLAQGHQGSDRHILVVDDNLSARETLEDLVHMCGCECDIASGGAEALIRIKERAYSAILLDINMPDIDGFEVAETTRRHRGPNQKTPIIAISGSSYIGITDDQRKLFSHLVDKPVRLAQLSKVLKTFTTATTGQTAVP